jgi:hypothetical protein
MKNVADCPAANTVSNRSTAAFSLNALPRGHHYVEAFGLVEVVDQGGGALTELHPMGDHGS